MEVTILSDWPSYSIVKKKKIGTGLEWTLLEGGCH